MEDRDSSDAEDFEPFLRVFPVETDVALVPDAEAVEVRLEIRIGDGVACPQVFTTDPPAFRKVEAHVLREELLDPGPVLTALAVDAASVDVAV